MRLNCTLGILHVCLALILSLGLSALVTAAGDSAASPSKVTQSAVPNGLLMRYLADKSTFTLIDARSAEEYSQAHIEGAVNIPFDKAEAYRHRLPEDKAAPLVIYCKSGRRAGLLQSTLQQWGYSNVRVLARNQVRFREQSVMFNCAT